MTLGEPAGIGPEVAAGALREGLERMEADLVLVLPAALERWWRQGLGAGLDQVALHLVAPDLALDDPSPGLPGAAHALAARLALEAMVALAARREVDAIVTGPVTKGIFDGLDPRPLGQTECVAWGLGVTEFAMMLAGPTLRVVPVTTHVALREVPALLTTGAIVRAGRVTHRALRDWYGIPAPRLAVAALNPHAGEGGRMGDEEGRVIAPAIEALRAEGLDATGPEVPDVVFHHAIRGRYDAVLCMYHDQGLAPLKTLHFDEGVNVTIGLPVPRISPDHGTAFDIAGRGVARPASFRAALDLAARLAHRGRLS